VKVSATEEFGVRCLVRLAEAWQQGRTATIPEVAAREDISPQYAAKLIGLARQAGLVASIRGVNGGVRLARDPAEITLRDAFAALTGEALRTGRCMDPDEPTCARAPGCGLRRVFGALHRVVLDVLSGVTLADMVRMEGDRTWRPAVVARVVRDVGTNASGSVAT
jgi:Rrf2 family protein